MKVALDQHVNCTDDIEFEANSPMSLSLFSLRQNILVQVSSN